MVRKFETQIEPRSIIFATDQYLLSFSYNTYAIQDISTGEVIIESSLGHYILALATSFDSKYIALSTADCTIHVGPLGTPIQANTSDIMHRGPMEKLWMRGRHLVQLYRHRTLWERHLLISDTVAIKVKGSSHVAISPTNSYVCVAFVTTDGLSVWNDMEGVFILDKSTDIIFLEYSPLGDRLISADKSNVVNIWDVNTRSSIGGPYIVPGYVLALAFSATGDNYVVAYRPPREPRALLVEVRVCQSGHVLNGPFGSGGSACSLDAVRLSAEETKIILITHSGIEILDAVTGKSEVNRQDPMGDIPVRRLSPNSKYIGWCPTGQNTVELWDIDNQVILHQLLPNGHLEDVFFSDDSVHIITLYSIDHRYYIDLWDILTRTTVKQGIQIFSMDNQPMSLNGTHLISPDWFIPKIVNLNIHQLMSSFYEYHGNHSQFGMLPIGNSEARWEIQTLSLPSQDEDILKYALMAWDKALFSMYAEINKDGWLLGPHNELLVWIPEERRKSLWRPCMTHMGTEHFTKLKFENFVHGTRWTECKGNL